MSTDDRKDLPPINAPNFLERVREVLSVYLGNRGDALNRGVTLRDLVDSGMATLDARFTGGGKSITPLLPVTPPTYEADLSPPPVPTGFAASAAISNILVECDAQTYTQGHGHAKSRLYGASWISGDLPVFANAVLLSEFQGTVASYATNPATTWRLWLTWVSVDGVESSTPAGGTNGLAVSTGQDVGLLLEALTGEITSSQLYAGLGARINLIDGTGPGSVAARILDEATARGAAIASEATTRASAVSAEAMQRTTLAARVTTAEGNINSNAAAITSEAAARATALSAEASARTTLASSVGANTAAISTETGTRATQTGDLFAQYTVKVDANGYISGFGLASTLKNAVPYSEFAVRADKFYIASPSGPGIAPIVPFVVTTSASTVNGVAVPAGVYMDAAFIKNGTITNAKIGDAAIDDAKITTLSATKLKAGTIAVGEYIQGSGYVAGSAGWRINGNGTAEFSGVVVRGEVHATSGTFTGDLNAVTMNSGNINLQGDGATGEGYIRSLSKWWSDGADGWILSRNGGTGNTFVDLQAGTSRFWMSNWGDCGLQMGESPAVSGSTMSGAGIFMDHNGAFCAGNASRNISFNGYTLTMNGDVVVTGNLVSNAVTVPVGSTGYGSIPSATITLPYAGKIMVMVSVNALAYDGSEASLYVTATCGGSSGPTLGISLGPSYSGALTAVGYFAVVPGTYTVGGTTSVTIGNRTITDTSLFAVGYMR